MFVVRMHLLAKPISVGAERFQLHVAQPNEQPSHFLPSVNLFPNARTRQNYKSQVKWPLLAGLPGVQLETLGCDTNGLG